MTEDCIDRRAFATFSGGMKDSFWGDLEGRTKLAWKHFSSPSRSGCVTAMQCWTAMNAVRGSARQYRNGYYERDFATRFGTIRLRIARPAARVFAAGDRRSSSAARRELAMLIREAFLRGISTRQVGRVVATLTGETVSAQTVSNLTRDLDHAVKQFHQAPLKDEWAYLFLDGVNLKVRRPAAASRADAGGLRRAPEWHPPAAGLSAHQRREPGPLGGAAQRSLPARPEGRQAAAGGHRRLSRTGRGHPDRLSPRRSSTLLGAQDAQHPGERCASATTTRSRPMRKPSTWPTAAPGLSCRARLLPALARRISLCGQADWSATCPNCWPFPLPQAPMAQAAHHQHHRTLFRRSAPKNPAHGLLRQRAVVDRIIYSIFQRFNLEWKTRTLRVFTQAA